MTVHAHPDDESSKGAPTIAKYRSDGVSTVLVCCTGGEQGDILNPAMDREDVRANLHAVRLQELDKAASVIGYEHVELLGYKDSGMAGSEANADPACFAQADEQEAVGRLVTLIRKYKPQVLISYSDDQELYPHPDHLRAHDVAIKAFDAAGDASAFPQAGDAWQPLKLYYTVWVAAKMRLMDSTLAKLGIELPFSEAIRAMPDNDHRITTRIDVEKWAHVRAEALLAHATQIDPESPIWFGLPEEVQMQIIGEDDYVLAKSLVETTGPEVDLFAGIR